ncbi:hypothetical protein [Microscilla marina]|uniref:Uncharacterized protein n=1 Tax=Microscilla marina ATCC 23134 TaxID=313606 RepID=A1ZYV9_MICM2|nr:hypothetical protein [Microscilla marina]EAY24456.1 hypothetical protein M23134_06310 [Microscilla marina ATCC 23134]
MAKYPIKYTPIEQQADQLWKAFYQTETEQFWRAYTGLAQKAKASRAPLIQPTQRQVTTPLPHKKTNPLSVMWVLRQITGFLFVTGLCGLLGYALYSFADTYRVMPETWRGYTTDTTHREVYALFDTKELLELKVKMARLEKKEKRLLKVLRDTARFAGKPQDLKESKKGLRKLLMPVLKNTQQKLDSHQRAFNLAYAPFLKKEMQAQKIKDSLFKDYSTQERPKLDSLYAYCQAKGVGLSQNTIKFYLKNAGGINFRSNPYNLSAKNQAVYNLFGTQDTGVFFYVATGNTLCRLKKLKGGYYTLLPNKGLVNIDSTLHHIYKAQRLFKYQGYQIQVKPLGVYYETEKAQYYIPKNRRKNIGIELKIELYQKAQRE